MNSIWIVVADSSRARIFATQGGGNGTMTEIQTLAHPQARLHEGDLVSDKSGGDRKPGSTGHDMGNEPEAKQEEAVRFATQVCHELESGRVSGRFEKLYIIAAPGFLGILRKHQSNPLQKLVAAEVSKNIATHDLEQIRKCLPDRL